MRMDAKHCLAGIAVFALALPLWGRTESTSMRFDNPVTIAGKQLKPGNYQFITSENQNELTVKRDGRVVAEVPCKWIKLTDKSPYSDVVTSENQIVEIDFDGKTEAVKVP